MSTPIGKVLDEGNCGRATDRGEEACGCMGKRRVCMPPTRMHPRQSCEATNRNVIQGRFDQASEPNITKPFPVGRSGKWRACAAKDHVLIRGDLPGGLRAVVLAPASKACLKGWNAVEQSTAGEAGVSRGHTTDPRSPIETGRAEQ